MPFKRIIAIVALLLFLVHGYGQTVPNSVSHLADTSLATDTSFDYDDLLDELDSFIDSLQAPRSYFLLNLAVTNGYFDFKGKGDSTLSNQKKMIFTPVIGYYHKAGPGITFSANMLDAGHGLQVYQYFINPSFDFIHGKKAIGGLGYTRYFTKDSLSFYTTPLQNEVTGYFLYRKAWLQPGLNAVYGWGSRKDLEQRKKFLSLRRIRLLRRLGYVVTTTTTSTNESIADFSVTGSLRHNFYWLNVFGQNDYIRFTPLLTFCAGTQQYGFNQTTGITAITARNTGGVVLNSGSTNLDSKTGFQPLSVTLSLKPEYAIGKFFIQPQCIFDYSFPEATKQFTVLYALNAGFMF